MKNTTQTEPAPFHSNSGHGPRFDVLNIGLPDRVGVVEAETGFWAVVESSALPSFLSGENVQEFERRKSALREEMDFLRGGIKPSAVYVNPTERCNFNCPYCYIPTQMRKQGKTMSPGELISLLEGVEEQYRTHLPETVTPQIIFHGSEPMMARESMFAAIEHFGNRFHFGMQTNASLLDDSAIDFLKRHEVAIGISLDAPTAEAADRLRHGWDGVGTFARVDKVIDALRDYPGFCVITTVTSANVTRLVDMVDFYHRRGVTHCMLNPVRCTQQGGWELKPDDATLAHHFTAALDRTWEHYQKTGQKLVVANFANVLAGIAGPTTRRLMCDVSPCGGGRCFVAVAANGDVFPCSEFVGFEEFRGGNILKDPLNAIMAHPAIRTISERRVEHITPCATCSIRHFCGAPCPAELHARHGDVNKPALYCRFYEEQARYALRVLALERHNAYLWDDWDSESEASFPAKAFG